MKNVLFVGSVVLMSAVISKPVLAVKEFQDEFLRIYVADHKNADFKKLVAEAKCNVCHIDMENRKNHNPFGAAAKELGMDKKKYQALLKAKDPKAIKEVEELFKKAEEKKIDDKGKTFGQKIKDGQLPGGDVHGK
jgi:hypothetical protein